MQKNSSFHDFTSGKNTINPIEGDVCRGVVHRAKQSMMFTLIELLVVVTIIAILAALLLPALSRARYMAKLATDANNQHQTAMGLFVYEDDYRQWDRAVLLSPPMENPFQALIKVDSTLDDRPRFAKYMSPGLQCPFRVDQSGSWTTTENLVYSPYVIYAGWQLAPNEGKMTRANKKITYRGEEFDILVSEKDGILPRYNKVSVAHPDHRTLWEKVLPGDRGSYWYTNKTSLRQPIDLHYTRTDGSTFRIMQVKYQDDRLVKVPHKYGESTNSRYQQLPNVSY